MSSPSGPPMGPPAGPSGSPPPAVTCYRHRDRRAGVSCQRCNRPICASCMIQASVGFHCPECVKASAKASPTYSTRTLPDTVPYVTYTLIAINVAVFVLDLSAGGNLATGSGRLFWRGTLTATPIVIGEWYRLLASGFLHIGALHLGVNMISLYVLGTQLEKVLGGVRFASLYFASLFAGSLGVLLVSPAVPTVGASGAIFGLMGALGSYLYINKISFWKSGFGPILFLNLFITFGGSSFISVGGHLGGLIGGAVVGYLMFQIEMRNKSPWYGVASAAVVAVVCIGTAIALAPQLIIIR